MSAKPEIVLLKGEDIAYLERAKPQPVSAEDLEALCEKLGHAPEDCAHQILDSTMVNSDDERVQSRRLTVYGPAAKFKKVEGATGVDAPKDVISMARTMRGQGESVVPAKKAVVLKEKPKKRGRPPKARPAPGGSILDPSTVKHTRSTIINPDAKVD